MPIVAKQSEGREPIAAGMYPSACCWVIDLGTQPSSNPSWKARQMVLLGWELLDEVVEFEKDGVKQSFHPKMSRSFGLSFGSAKKPTEFRKLLESWRSRPFTDEELKGFDLKNVVGVNGLLTVVHNNKEGNTYANVGSVGPLMKGMPKRAPETPIIYFSLSDVPQDATAVDWPDSMPEFIREKIRKSEEYCARFGGDAGNGADNGYPPPHGDDDIPF